jgi:hypothetical protein
MPHGQQGSYSTKVTLPGVKEVTLATGDRSSLPYGTSVIFQGQLFKEVLRRENQGLKVHPVDGSSVFSMTGTYFCFVLSVLSGLIFKKTPEAGMLFSCHSSCAE